MGEAPPPGAAGEALAVREARAVPEEERVAVPDAERVAAADALHVHMQEQKAVCVGRMDALAVADEEAHAVAEGREAVGEGEGLPLPVAPGDSVASALRLAEGVADALAVATPETAVALAVDAAEAQKEAVGPSVKVREGDTSGVAVKSEPEGTGEGGLLPLGLVDMCEAVALVVMLKEGDALGDCEKASVTVRVGVTAEEVVTEADGEIEAQADAVALTGAVREEVEEEEMDRIAVGVEGALALAAPVRDAVAVRVALTLAVPVGVAVAVCSGLALAVLVSVCVAVGGALALAELVEVRDANGLLVGVGDEKNEDEADTLIEGGADAPLDAEGADALAEREGVEDPQLEAVDAAALAVGVTETQIEAVGESITGRGVSWGVSETVGDADFASEPDALGEGELLPLAPDDGRKAVAIGLLLKEGDAVDDCDNASVPVRVGVTAEEAVTEADGEIEEQADAVALPGAVREEVEEEEADCVVAGVEVALALETPVSDSAAVRVALALAVPVGVAVAVCSGLAVAVLESVCVAVGGALALVELVKVSVTDELLVGVGDDKTEKEAVTLIKGEEDAELDAEGADALAEGEGVADPQLEGVGVTALVAVAAPVGEPVVELLALPAVGMMVGNSLGETLALAHPLAEGDGLLAIVTDAMLGLLEAELVAAEALGLPEGDALPLSSDAVGVTLLCADNEADGDGEAVRVCGECVALREDVGEDVACGVGIGMGERPSRVRG